MKYFITILVLLTLCITNNGQCEDRLRIVATLTTFGSLAKTIGGDYVDVSSVASPRFNPHFIEPKPSDVLRLKRADLYVHSGLDLEAWGGPLVDAAARADIRANGQRQVSLAQGISLLEVPTGQVSRAEGDIHLFGNPHYWLDPRNSLIMARTLCAKLTEIDPAHRTTYEENRDRFIADANEKIREWQALAAPRQGEKLVGYHNEWVYLMNFLGFTMEVFLEPKPGIPPSPAHIASVVQYMQATNVRAIIQPSFYPSDAAQETADRAGATVVIAAQNVGEIPEATDYLSLIDVDIHRIIGE